MLKLHLKSFFFFLLDRQKALYIIIEIKTFHTHIKLIPLKEIQLSRFLLSYLFKVTSIILETTKDYTLKDDFSTSLLISNLVLKDSPFGILVITYFFKISESSQLLIYLGLKYQYGYFLNILLQSLCAKAVLIFNTPYCIPGY